MFLLPYNKEKFLKSVQGEDCLEVIRLAKQEVNHADNAPPTRVKRGDNPLAAQTANNNEWRRKEYSKFLKGFIFFIEQGYKSGIKPRGISDSDFQLFRPVCENLLKKGQFSSQAMTLFEQT